eukprot:ANDGO_04491.mRNA.1 Sodium/glucose cotransporter
MVELEVSLQPIDWILLATYFVLVIASGLYSSVRDRIPWLRRRWSGGVGRRGFGGSNGGDDGGGGSGSQADGAQEAAQSTRAVSQYFLASRDVGWFAAGLSLFSSNIGSEHFIGLAGSGASRGVVVSMFEWMPVFILMLLAFFFVPVYLSAAIFTLPEFLEKRFSMHCRALIAISDLILYVLTKISASLFAASLLLELLLGWDWYFSAFLLVFVTGGYTLAGGLKAVIVTEVIQTAVLISGAVTLLIVSMVNVGGVPGLMEKLPASYFRIVQPADDKQFPWPGCFFGIPVLALWYWCFDQVQAQRVLSAKNQKNAEAACVLASGFKILNPFTLIFTGMAARVLFPEIVGPNPNLAFPVLVSELLPAGARGLMISAMLSAAMSSLASVFNSASTVFTMDVYTRFKKRTTPRELLLVGRLATLLIIVCALLWIPLMPRSSSSLLFVYIQDTTSNLSPTVAVTYLSGIVWPRANARGALTTLICGFSLGFYRLFSRIFKELGGYDGSSSFFFFANMNYLYFALLSFGAGWVIMVTVSLLSAAPPRDKVVGIAWMYRRHVDRVRTSEDEHRIQGEARAQFAEDISVLELGGQQDQETGDRKMSEDPETTDADALIQDRIDPVTPMSDLTPGFDSESAATAHARVSRDWLKILNKPAACVSVTLTAFLIAYFA